MRVSVAEHAGAFAEDKDVARRLRQEVVETSLAKGEKVVLDFAGVELATQSFIHALICDVIRGRGPKALDKISFKGGNATVKSLIRVASEYTRRHAAHSVPLNSHRFSSSCVPPTTRSAGSPTSRSFHDFRAGSRGNHSASATDALLLVKCALESQASEHVSAMTNGPDLTRLGCIQLVSPTFFPPAAWIPQPADWQPRTQTPVKYDLALGEGRRVWEACLTQASSLPATTPFSGLPLSIERGRRYGDPRLVEPRLGQATFRIAVLDAYGRACAVTRERSLPALEASHIRAYAQDGPHEIRNGLLLRAELHRLFDTGYVTVTPKLRLEVSARLQQDYKNGRSYYPLHGAELQVPSAPSHQPDRRFLVWHNEHVFRD